jgi:hypothetical protein
MATSGATARQGAWSSTPAWFRNALFVGFGGMLFISLSLIIAAALAEYDSGSRIAEDDSTTALTWAAWGAGITAVGLFLLLRIVRIKAKRAFWLIVMWAAGSAALGALAVSWQPLSLLVFLLFWAVFAAPAGGLVAVVAPPAAPSHRPPPVQRRASPPPPPPGARPARQPAPPPPPPIGLIGGMIGGTSGGTLGATTGGSRRVPLTPMAAVPRRAAMPAPSGRIPPEVADLLSTNVQTVRAVVLSEIKADTAGPRRGFTAAAVMDRVLRDWWENGNIDPLTPDDVTDLQSFVALSVSLSAGIPQPEAEAVYRALVTALLDDWLVAWNADGNVGPPIR